MRFIPPKEVDALIRDPSTHYVVGRFCFPEDSCGFPGSSEETKGENDA